jgi:hypothetical protein
MKPDVLLLTKKILFKESVTFEDRMAIRDELQYLFVNYIFSFNSDNDLIIRGM